LPGLRVLAVAGALLAANMCGLSDARAQDAKGDAGPPSKSATKQSARAPGPVAVDLELVLAVDVSMSMDVAEQKHQRAGYVAAFRSQDIIDAITKTGTRGRIAVTYFEWAGVYSQSVVVPWRVIDGAEAAFAFAAELEGKERTRAYRTSISTALARSAALFDGNAITAPRRVIDVSGDGPNNAGSRVDEARDAVVARGITINGLALQFPRPEGPYTYFDLPDLDRYYAGCVIGGPGAFMISVKSQERFGQAIRRKLLLEIADLQPSQRPAAPRIRKIQFRLKGAPPPYDCLVGEKRWRQYQLEQW
ncbi:MAG: DUF1194 domain-containing protein, partial [Pseudomonadota bacterium]